MSPDEFRRWGHEAVEWVARYLETIEDHPVASAVSPGEIRARFPEHPPAHGEPFDRILADTDRLLDGLTHWQAPGFFGYFPANASGPSIIGELISAGLGVQGMLWATSPACTELETLVLDWLVELCGLPERFRGRGVIQDSASSATLCALLAARHRAARRGAPADRMVAYASDQAHSSVEKACRIAGLGHDRLRLVAVDDHYALRPAALADTIAADVAAGLIPTFVAATVGTTSSTALDPVPAIADAVAGTGAWLHVDAAYAGAAAVCPELRFLNDGVDRADSYAFNPHKWLLTNFDCDAFYVADPDTLVAALSIVPEYLRNTASESGAVIDYRDWQVPLGRRFRALKLWYVLRWYGADGLRRHIRGHVGLARRFAGWVEDDSDFELAAPVPLGLVCFRHRGGDEVNQRILDAVNAEGRIFITHTRLDGSLTLRLALGAPGVELRHVRLAWDQIRDAAAAAAGR